MVTKLGNNYVFHSQRYKSWRIVRKLRQGLLGDTIQWMKNLRRTFKIPKKMLKRLMETLSMTKRNDNDNFGHLFA